MTLRAEQIIDAIASLIEDSATQPFSGNVYKHRAQSLSEEQGDLPAISVDIGEDTPLDEDGASNISVLDSLLTVETSIAIREGGEHDARTALFAARRSIHVAVMADQSLGLAFVIGIRYGGADAPEINTESEYSVGRLVCRWAVHYRMTVTDPGD